MKQDTRESVIGVYSTRKDAESAVRTLDEAKFPINQISILGTDISVEDSVQGFLTTGDVIKSSIATGAWFGGFFGLLRGAAFFLIPGFGPLFVTGAIVAAFVSTLEGALVGATAVGLLGALVGYGVSQEHILMYKDELKRGKFLVIVSGTVEQVKNAHATLAKSKNDMLTIHSDY